MTHARQTIRANIKEILLAGKHPQWGTVVDDRVPLDRTAWPYLMVYTDSDAGDPNVSRPAAQIRDLTIIITGMVRLSGTGEKHTVEAKMDAIAEAVEERLTFDAVLALNSGVKEVTLLSTDLEVVETEDQKVDHAEVTMTWRFIYATLEGQPSIFI